jgi:SNF2 family DNA or RNA helicase
MSILHGCWHHDEPTGRDRFFLWGEVWRRLEEGAVLEGRYPYAMEAAEIAKLVQAYGDPASIAGEMNLLLPTDQGLPQLSASENAIETQLQSWQVAGVWLEADQIWRILTGIPLGSRGTEWLGDDLRFWGHIARWGLDLLARGKFIPNSHGDWQVLLDSATDQTRWQEFVRGMPLVAQGGREAIVLGLNALIRSQIPPLPWIEPTPEFETLQPWLRPVQSLSQNFRTVLKLEPPEGDAAQWQVLYGLQAVDDPLWTVFAPVLWQHPVDQLDWRSQSQTRTIGQPQETMLRGLGVAAKLYPELEPSLQVACPVSCGLTLAQAYEFIHRHAWRLQESGVGVLLPESLRARNVAKNRLSLQVQAQTPSDKAKLGLQSLLNFAWQLSIAGQSLTKSEFDRLVAQETPLVQVNGEWLELQPQDVRAAQAFFATRKNETQISLEEALRLSTEDSPTIGKLPVVDFQATGPLQELFTTLSAQQQPESINPKELKGTLRPYQAKGVGWLAFLERWGLGACLADDMGLGKTLQLIAFLLHLKAEKRLTGPVLIICPTSVLGNWEREMLRFAPKLRVLSHHGDLRSQGPAFAKSLAKQDVVLTSYALSYRDLSTLKPIPWQGVVLDEAQNIKNAESKQSLAIRELPAQFRIALTGTPVENRLMELWSILEFLNPGYLGPKNFFQRRFTIPIERYGDSTSLQALRSLVQPFILRRLKTDSTIIQDLPEKQEIPVFCSLSESQAVLYQRVVDETLKAIESSQGIQRKGLILGLLVRLKQLCNHPDLIESDNITEEKLTAKKTTDKKKVLPASDVTEPEFLQASGKLQRLTEMLENVISSGDRALIFTQFSTWGKLLKPYLEAQFGQEVLFLYGSTTKNAREAMVDRFQNDPQAPRIFILSLKAGGVGLNLTRANHVFHYDRWWNPAVENQASDRAFRIGQMRNVQIYKFICKGTLEERIHDMIEQKQALAQQVVGTGENWLTEFDSDQLRDLLLLDRSAILGDTAPPAAKS